MNEPTPDHKPRILAARMWYGQSTQRTQSLLRCGPSSCDQTDINVHTANTGRDMCTRRYQPGCVLPTRTNGWDYVFSRRFAGGVKNRAIISQLLPKILLLGLGGLDIDDSTSLRLLYVHILFRWLMVVAISQEAIIVNISHAAGKTITAVHTHST